MPILIIPGFFSQKKTYELLRKRFIEAGFEAEIAELGLNIRSLKHTAQIVLLYLKKAQGEVDIIAHSYGGLLLKQSLLMEPAMLKKIKSISFVAVPHKGSWASLLEPVWPATQNMMPFSKALKKTAEAELPKKIKNFLPTSEIKIWPKKSSFLNNSADTFIQKTGHDSIIDSQDFVKAVIEFIKNK